MTSPTIDELLVGDEPDAWTAAGFTVDPDGVCRIGSVRVRLTGPADGKYLKGWSLRDAPIADGTLDGIATSSSDAATSEGATHPNGTTSIDHIVVVTPDLGRTAAALEGIGLTERGRRDSDTYGFPARQLFFKLAEVILEVVGPVEPAGDGPTRFFGLAFTVDDLDALPERYGPKLGDIKDAVQPGRRIATLRHKEFGMSVATAFMTPEPDEG